LPAIPSPDDDARDTQIQSVRTTEDNDLDKAGNQPRWRSSLDVVVTRDRAKLEMTTPNGKPIELVSEPPAP
jgi:hypothetical protein